MLLTETRFFKLVKEGMMLIRNSLLSLVRTKGKTFLFTLLIVACDPDAIPGGVRLGIDPTVPR